MIELMRDLVGRSHVLTDTKRSSRFWKGYRFGEGKVLAVVQPGTLVEQWKVFCLAIKHECVVVFQAANTGLTGGSTPFGNYDRDVIIINTLRIDRIDVIGSGSQAVCLAGSTLLKLTDKLRPFGREPHSTIGSTTIGASVVGGVCNNSGGALLRRGPAFTQLALFAQVSETGEVQLRNHLGIELGDEPEEILGRLDNMEYEENDISYRTDRLASDPDYETIIRDIDSPTPARFNNDPRLLYEASGCAGKLCVFAVRVDTFPKPAATKVFYVGTNDYLELTNLRRHVLANFVSLPTTAEYLHRSAYDLSKIYGKDIFLFLKYIGAERINIAFKLKRLVDSVFSRFKLGSNLSDKIIQTIVNLLPDHLPRRMEEYRDLFEHHLIIKAQDDGIEEMRKFLMTSFPTAAGNYFECSDDEASEAFQHRFASGGATVRYRSVHSNYVGEIVALDAALPRNELDWRERVPPELEDYIVRRCVYGHFFCHVFHYDYILKRDVDWVDIEERLVHELEKCGLQLPSEHNVGHLYRASAALLGFYRSLDPTNSLNSGIGKTSKRTNWA